MGGGGEGKIHGMGSVKRGESRWRVVEEEEEEEEGASEAEEGVRTNAICMILHVLARPGCAHRVSAFCLRFPLAFLAAASHPTSHPPRNGGGGA